MKQFLRIAIISIVVALLLFFVLSRFGVIKNAIKAFFDILTPFLVGALIAFLLRPLCNKLDRVFGDWFVNRLFRRRIENGKTTEKRLRSKAEGISIFIAMIVFFLIVIGVCMLVIPAVIESIITLKDDLPGIIAQFSTYMEGLKDTDSVVSQFVYDSYQTILKTLSESSGSWIDTLLANYMSLITTAGAVIGAILGTLVDLLVTLVSAVYILGNRKRFASQANLIAHALFKKKTADWVVNEVQFANRKFSEFFAGKLLDSSIVGVILYIVLAIFKMPSAPLIAVFMACCNMIPFFGPYIGFFPCALIVLMADITQPINVIYFLIIVVVIQQLDGNILDPYIVGDNVGLSSFWVLFAVLLFGDLFGFVGLLLGVPLFAVLYDIIRQLVNFGLTKRGEEQLMANYNFIYHNPEEEREALKKRAAAIKAARKAARAKASAEAQETMERELAIAQAAAAARAEVEAEMQAREEEAQAQEAALTDETPQEAEPSETPEH